MVPGSKVKIIRRDSPLYGKVGIIQGLGHTHVIEEFIVLFERTISDHYPYMATLMYPWDVEVVSRYDKTTNEYNEVDAEQKEIKKPINPKSYKLDSSFIKKKPIHDM